MAAISPKQVFSLMKTTPVIFKISFFIVFLILIISCKNRSESYSSAPIAASSVSVKATPVSNTIVTTESHAAPYFFKYDLTESEFQASCFDAADSYKNQGYYPVRITGYLKGIETNFATKWVKGAMRDWYAYYKLTDEAFNERLSALNTDYRPIDVGAYNLPDGAVRHTIVWVRNTENIGWRVHTGSSLAELKNLIKEYSDLGYYPARVEAYHVNNKIQYISLWEKGDKAWKMQAQMTRAQYTKCLSDYKRGYDLTHIDAIAVQKDVFYTGIWWENNHRAEIRTNQNEKTFQRHVNNNIEEDKEIENFYAAETPQGLRYGGIWETDTKDDDPESLFAQIKKEVNASNGKVGVMLYNLTTGDSIIINERQSFGAASTIKIAILYALLRKMDAEKNFTLSTTFNMGKQYGSNQGNIFKANLNYTLSRISWAMIAYSNNWATNRLMDFIGTDNINQEMEALGLLATRLTRYTTGTGAPGMHSKSGPRGDYKKGFDNTSTPWEMVKLLRLIHENKGLLSKKSYDFFWEMLNSDYNGGTNTKGYLPDKLYAITGLIDSVTIYNKTGNNNWTGHHEWNGLDNHTQYIEAGRLNFRNGQIVFYAMFLDDGEPSDYPEKSLTEDCLRCLGVKIVRGYTQSKAPLPKECR